MRRTDALIVGGGPAGSAAAITLAEAGRDVVLIERTIGPHDTVCGGFVGWDALASLNALGIEAGTLGARPITKARLVGPSSEAEFALPHAAAGLSRRTLDEALLARAAEAGAEVRRGMVAREVDLDTGTARLDDDSNVGATLLCLATGKHHVRGAPERRENDLSVGLRIALDPDDKLSRRVAGTVELHLYDGGYAGLLMQEDGTTNFCLSVREATFKAAGGIEPLLKKLGDRNAALRPILDCQRIGDWSTIAGVPYGWRQRERIAGASLLGDRAAVISSLAGDGIAIALESGRRVIERDFQVRFASSARRPVALASMLRRAAESDAARSTLIAAARRFPGLATRTAGMTRIR